MVGGLRGLSFAQIVRIAHTNAPSLTDFEKDLSGQVGAWSTGNWQGTFSLEVFAPPALGSTSSWWRRDTLTWPQMLKHSEAWLQVRHSLIHGLTRGYLPEVWPSPLKAGTPANFVLREQKNQKHSLSLHSAISCARVLRYGAEELAKQAALTLGEKPPKWRAVPAFPLDADED